MIRKGLSEDTVRLISEKKNEPEWMLEFRLKAYRQWLKMARAEALGEFRVPGTSIIRTSSTTPRRSRRRTKASLDEVDPELLRTFEKLGIPLTEQKMLANVAVDAVFDSVSVATTYKEKLKKHGVIFCSFTEAVERLSRADQEVSRLGRARRRQLLRGAELGGLLGRLVRLYPEGRSLPDGAVDLFPHQHSGIGAVRAHANRCRGRRLRRL